MNSLNLAFVKLNGLHQQIEFIQLNHDKISVTAAFIFVSPCRSVENT